MSQPPTDPTDLGITEDKFLQLVEGDAQSGVAMMSNPTIAGMFDAMMNGFAAENSHAVVPDPDGLTPSQAMAARFQRHADDARQARDTA